MPAIDPNGGGTIDDDDDDTNGTDDNGNGDSAPGWLPGDQPGWWRDAATVIPTLAGLSAAGVYFIENPAEFIINVVVEYVVGWMLALLTAILEAFATAFVAVLTSIQDGIFAPLLTFSIRLQDALLAPGEAIQEAMTEAVLELGIAAPFAALAGFVATLVFYAMLLQFAYGFLRTYLPLDAVARPGEIILGALRAPFRAVSDRLGRVRQRLSRGDS